MTPLTVFYRTLMKSSAVFLGAGWIMLHPSLDWRPASARSAAGGWSLAGTGVTAQKSPTEAAIDGLVLALKDTDPGVRRQAAAALGQLGSARAVPGLVEALKDAQADVRLRATIALGEIGDASGAQALTAALKDTDPRVRARAAHALGEIGDRAAVDPLVGAVRDASAEVRRRAISALAEIGDSRAVDPITAALKDDDAGVRRAAGARRRILRPRAARLAARARLHSPGPARSVDGRGEPRAAGRRALL